MKRIILADAPHARETYRRPGPDPMTIRSSFDRSPERTLFPMNHFTLR